MAIPLATIQLLARWSIGCRRAVLWQKYLCHRSRSCGRQAVCSRDLQEMVSAARQELDAVAASFREALSSELQSASQAVLGQRGWKRTSGLCLSLFTWAEVMVRRMLSRNRALKNAPCLRMEGDMWLEVRLLQSTRFSPVPGPLSGTLQGLFSESVERGCGRPVRRRGEGHKPR